MRRVSPRSNVGACTSATALRSSHSFWQKVEEGSLTRASLLFTSPPYYAITNYHYDQWLRLWLLGGPPNALRNGNGLGGKFEARESYRRLLERVFSETSRILEEDATVYVRTDAREFTYRTTVNVLCGVFADKELEEVRRPMLRVSQTHLFGERARTSSECGEIDLILSPR